MRIILVLFVTSYISSSNGIPTIGRQLGIVNGSNAEVGEFPFMCGLYYNYCFTCGCTILNNEWILTAAHCVFNRDPSKFSVLTGTNDLLDPNGTETHVSKVIIHEAYKNSDNQQNDIALLMLDVQLEYDSLTQPVTLSTYETDPAASSSVTVIGWGYNNDTNPMRCLQKATIDVYSNTRCSGIYKPYNIPILPTNICAGVAQGGKGQCTGDSGGPVISFQNNISIQVGIISFSAKPCGIAGYPGVNTRTSKYLDWIKKNVM